MNKLVTLATVVAVQAALVGAAVAPQLSARLTGDTYYFRVAPLDPIDPFRGAYVTLDYPDLPRSGQAYTSESGPLYVTLVEENGVMVADDHLTERPSGDQPYLACRDRGWHFQCGIESLFLRQDEAAAMDELLSDGAIAEVKIDGRGHAALIDVRAP
jgi:uncharacterized membrane-anchored protein